MMCFMCVTINYDPQHQNNIVWTWYIYSYNMQAKYIILFNFIYSVIQYVNEIHKGNGMRLHQSFLGQNIHLTETYPTETM